MTEFYQSRSAVCAPNKKNVDYQLAEPLAEQLDLFADPARWPHKPYCTEALERGIYPRSLKSALLRPYIQANPPHLRVWSIYDIDRPGGALAWEDGRGLPPPAWASVNRENKHAHLVYGLKVPVLVESLDARRAPIRYLVAVEQAFRAHMRADNGYSGLITKNPSHPMWTTYRGPNSAQAYDLGELADWVDLPKFLPKQGVLSEEIGLGRNCILFDFLRKWSYKAVRAERGSRNLAVWQAKVFDRAIDRNGDFKSPLDFGEVKHIAKSVAKWVWGRDPAAEKAFSAVQAYRGRMGGVASAATRLSKNEDKRSSAALMASTGMKQAEIAKALAVSQPTVSLWLKSFTNEA